MPMKSFEKIYFFDCRNFSWNSSFLSHPLAFEHVEALEAPPYQDDNSVYTAFVHACPAYQNYYTKTPSDGIEKCWFLLTWLAKAALHITDNVLKAAVYAGDALCGLPPILFIIIPCFVKSIAEIAEMAVEVMMSACDTQDSTYSYYLAYVLRHGSCISN